MVAVCKYEGTVAFGRDYCPAVRSVDDMANELQATFQNNDEVYMFFAPDGLSVSIQLDNIGEGDWPRFTASLADMASEAASNIEEGDDSVSDPKLLIAELRRIADLLEQAMATRATHPGETA